MTNKNMYKQLDRLREIYGKNYDRYAKERNEFNMGFYRGAAEALEAFENWLKDAERNGDNGI